MLYTFHDTTRESHILKHDQHASIWPYNLIIIKLGLDRRQWNGKKIYTYCSVGLYCKTAKFKKKKKKKLRKIKIYICILQTGLSYFDHNLFANKLTSLSSLDSTDLGKDFMQRHNTCLV